MAEPARELATPPDAEPMLGPSPAGPGRVGRTIPIVAADTGAKARPRSAPSPRTPADTQPYRAYRPAPFTAAERGQATVLLGGLHWRVERLFQGLLENLGHKAQLLPTATLADLMAGREAADIGQCSPTSFTTGNLANFLRGEAQRIGAEEVTRRYVHFTAGSCGACRFGQYHQSYELALRNAGLESFRMFLLGQDGIDQGAAPGGGLELNLAATLGAVWSIVLTDIIQDLEYRVRPYERNAGETDRVVHAAIDDLQSVFRERPRRGGRGLGSALWHLGTSYFVDAMKDVRRRFETIELDRLRVKPVVKITGEFYLQTVEGEPNHNIHRWLEAEGAEVYPAAITVWLDYLMRLAVQDNEDRIGIKRGARMNAAAVRLAQKLLLWTHGRMRRALGGAPRDVPPQAELRALAAPWFHNQQNGGEGDMLVGQALWAHLHHKAHMICELSPYSCMPNTMSVGAMAGVLGMHPDLLYAPIEVKGDAEVHVLSRCQMILTEARKRAQREYDGVLQRIGLTEAQLREIAARYPDLNRATAAIPHHGVTGSAANFALHLATLQGRHPEATAPGASAAAPKAARA
jgi:predicted nucleotide-binding protein (sugar kinase/HSP70/actin superfamily)